VSSWDTNLNWRRYNVLEWDDQPFYQDIARSIGEPSYSRWRAPNDWSTAWTANRPGP
jgi:hypothetical protein